jgi:hypothetical protein
MSPILAGLDTQKLNIKMVYVGIIFPSSFLQTWYGLDTNWFASLTWISSLHPSTWEK